MTQPSCFSYSYPYLKSLNVGSNRFGTNGLSALVFSLVTQNMFPELELLDIGTYKATADMGELPNHFETQQDYELLHQLITCPNLHLRSLQMNTCHIPPEHLLLLSYSIMQNQTLWHVIWDQMVGDIKQDHKQDQEKDQEKKYSKEIYMAKQLVETHLEKNRAKIVTKERIRQLKHGSDIDAIDSVYRNNM